MKLLVVYLAALGFIVSAIAHVAAIRGVILGGEGLLFVYLMGIFLVFLPTVFAMSKKLPMVGPQFTWSEVLRYCPVTVRALFYATFLYAMGSLIFLLIQGTQMKHRSGEQLTAQAAQGFSCLAMAFYMTSAAVMLSLHREERKLPNLTSVPAKAGKPAG